jgi:hypothetical protein
VNSSYGAVNRYCGNEYPPHRLLVGNEAVVTFYTDGSEDDVNSDFVIDFTGETMWSLLLLNANLLLKQRKLTK